MTKTDRLSQRLQELERQQRLRTLTPRHCEGVYLVETGGRRLLNFGGNDYLGLVAQQRAAEAPSHLPEHREVATGSSASPLVCGWTNEHQRLAETIAEFESTESSVIFPTGYAAGCGSVATLAGPEDLILSDQLNHASLIDGCRLSRAACIVYPHRDCDVLERTLEEKRNRFQRVWIVTDGVFSMDGHVAPLVEIGKLAERYDADVIVDEAHGTGVLGEKGGGVCEALEVKDRIAVRIGTLSKAIGCQGGFVAGSQCVVDYLTNHCRTLIYSTALAPAAVAASLVSLQMIRDQPERRRRVQQLASQLRNMLSIESDAIESTVPIIPVLIGGDRETLAASNRLGKAGFYVPAIRPPTVPEGTARLRVSLSAAHDESMVSRLAAAIGEL